MPAAKAERGAASDDRQGAQAAEADDQFVRQAFGQDRELGIVAGERKHGDRRPRIQSARQCRPVAVGSSDGHFADEAEALAVHRPDQPLRLAVVANQAPDLLDARRDGAIADRPAVPDRGDQLVLADQPVAVLDQQEQQREHLRLDGDRTIVLKQLEPAQVEDEIAHRVTHRQILARPTKSTKSPPGLQACARRLAYPGPAPGRRLTRRP